MAWVFLNGAKAFHVVLKGIRQLLTLCMRQTPKWVLLKTVKTQMNAA